MTVRRVAAPAAVLLFLGLAITGPAHIAAAVTVRAVVEVPAGTVVTDWAVLDRNRDEIGDAGPKQVKRPTVLVGEVSAKGALSREVITAELTDDAQDAVADGARIVLRVPVAKAKAMAGTTLSVVAWSGAATQASSSPDYARPGPAQSQSPGPLAAGSLASFDVTDQVARLDPGPVTFRVGLASTPPKDRRRSYVTLRTTESRVAGPSLVLLVPDELVDLYGPAEEDSDALDDAGEDTGDDDLG
jgi:hypothetical protein